MKCEKCGYDDNGTGDFAHYCGKLNIERTPMNKLTKEQAVVITGFTGIMACRFSDFHEDVERRMGHPIWTHEFGNKDFMKKVKELYKNDFLSLLETE